MRLKIFPAFFHLKNPIKKDSSGFDKSNTLNTVKYAAINNIKNNSKY